MQGPETAKTIGVGPPGQFARANRNLGQVQVAVAIQVDQARHDALEASGVADRVGDRKETAAARSGIVRQPTDRAGVLLGDDRIHVAVAVDVTDIGVKQTRVLVDQRLRDIVTVGLAGQVQLAIVRARQHVDVAVQIGVQGARKLGPHGELGDEAIAETAAAIVDVQGDLVFSV